MPLQPWNSNVRTLKQFIDKEFLDYELIDFDLEHKLEDRLTQEKSYEELTAELSDDC